MTTSMDLGVFFEYVRGPLFNGSLTVSQVKGCERLIGAWSKYGYGLDNGLAYILATSYHETGRRMQPVRETFAASHEEAIRNLDQLYAAGKLKTVKTPYWRDGFYGKGDVQLTHKYNHEGPLRTSVKDEFGVDILTEPEMVMRPDVSAFILIEGMTKGRTGKGEFTGHTLEEYCNEQQSDYVNARQTVNPKDYKTYDKIAQYAMAFEDAIREARVSSGRSFRGPNNDLYDGRVRTEVRRVQEQLVALGYTEVGTIDGRWGPLTQSAILSFKADNQLPVDRAIDERFLAKIAVASPRPGSTARLSTTLPELREAGSRTIRDADIVQTLSGLAVAAAAADLAAPLLGHVPGGHPAAVLIDGAAPSLTILFAVLAGWKAQLIKLTRLDDHQTGKNTGR